MLVAVQFDRSSISIMPNATFLGDERRDPGTASIFACGQGQGPMAEVLGTNATVRTILRAESG